MILPALLFLGAFFLVPLAYMVNLSLEPDWSLAHYQRLVGNTVYGRIALNTFALSLVVTLICLLLGYPLAFLIAHAQPRTRRLLIVPVMIPYLTSLMVRSYAWMVLLGREGPINAFLAFFGLGPFTMMNTTFAVYVGMVHAMLPLMVLPLYAVMSNVDMRLVRASSSLGASPSMTFRRVYLPLTLPGVWAGSCLVLVTTLGFFIIPAILGGPRNQTVATLIERQVGVALSWGFASALGLVLLVATLAVLAIALGVRRLLRRSPGDFNLFGARA
jgi:ABC-type spermidine/putrescine transport system permease subunit I